MLQIGQIKTFTLPGSVPVGSNLTFVWNWWDGTVSVTPINTVQKQLNVGGSLVFSCRVVDALGNSQLYTSSLYVNQPPVFSQSPAISRNDAIFPYQTFIQASLYDPEMTSVAFYWYSGATPLGSGTVSVTDGTGTTVFPYSVDQNTSLTLLAVDQNGTNIADSGSTTLDFSLRGMVPLPPNAGAAAIADNIFGVVGSSTLLITSGQSSQLTAYAQGHGVNFQWNFLIENGWPYNFSSSGTTTPISSGLQNTYLLVLSGTEVPGEKLIECAITNAQTGAVTVAAFGLDLVAPEPLEVISIVCSATQAVDPLGNVHFQVPVNQQVIFTGSIADPNGAIPVCKWSFQQPAGFDYYGGTLVFQPADYPIYLAQQLPLPIIGNLIYTDRFGFSGTSPLPALLVVS